jgi:hypothetical protein
MGIHARISALREIRRHEYLIRFVFGGSVTVIAALVAKMFGPVVGGLFLAFPAIFPATATLIAKHQERKKSQLGLDGVERGKLTAAVDARGAAIGSIALLLFSLAVGRLLPAWPLAAVLAAALLVWLTSAIVLWWLIRKLPLRLRP